MATAAAGEQGRALRRLRAERREKVARDYQARHPERAAEERRLKEANRAALKRYKADWAGTPQTRAKASRVQQGALARLFLAGHLTIDQLAAAEEIRNVAERIAGDVRIGTVSLETRVDGGRNPHAPFFEKLGQVRSEIAYTEWRRAVAMLRGGAAPVLAMIVDDVSCTEAARRFRMRKATARARLTAALDLWSDCIRRACKEVDEASLLAAQAGLL